MQESFITGLYKQGCCHLPSQTPTHTPTPPGAPLASLNSLFSNPVYSLTPGLGLPPGPLKAPLHPEASLGGSHPERPLLSPPCSYQSGSQHAPSRRGQGPTCWYPSLLAEGPAGTARSPLWLALGTMGIMGPLLPNPVHRNGLSKAKEQADGGASARALALASPSVPPATAPRRPPGMRAHSPELPVILHGHTHLFPLTLAHFLPLLRAGMWTWGGKRGKRKRRDPTRATLAR